VVKLTSRSGPGTFGDVNATLANDDNASADDESRQVPAPRDGVEDLPCTSAEKLLELLSPMHALWADAPSKWIYRGQADANWTIKAKATRSSHPFRDFGIDGDNPLDKLLYRFRDRIDQAGLQLPPSVAALEGIRTRPARVALLALAQHHGIPTDILDWTRRPRVAAYFAAVDSASREATVRPPYLAVWALLFRPKNMFGLEIHRAPLATNHNLRAQAGVFTAQWSQETRALSLEQAVQVVEAQAPGTATLRRLIMPSGEAPKLLRLLSYEGIDGASMFPGVDGVVRALREQALWDRPDPE
jgi:FRG domain-containing protein